MQDGMAQQAADGAQASTQTQPQTAHGGDLAVQLDSMRQEIAKLKDENGNRRLAAKTAEDAAAQAAADAGNYELQAKQYKAQLEELKPKLAMVDEAQEFMAATAREIDAIKATLPVYMQTAIDVAPTTKAKRDILSQYQSANPLTSQPRSTANPPANANPASAPAIDFAAVVASQDVARLDDAKKRDPDGLRKYFESISSSGRHKTSLI